MPRAMAILLDEHGYRVRVCSLSQQRTEFSLDGYSERDIRGERVHIGCGIARHSVEKRLIAGTASIHSVGKEVSL